ncbi:hydroquinone glucosyltransferase-like [Dorcoceras hygrometricum]|uniref:Glycosyltransferase n=1 Tax=Dorcoceras hygrometricum TaxID=472368 RepID=A0A2Z7BLH7_9LAMI|nr:hydroquinone glucosyltransferase-like [Dorcoceras hygrometricum]
MKPHVAFLPSPGMGHFIPLFQLARSLVFNRGFQVSFFVITTQASAAQDHFIRSAAEISPDLRIISLPEADVSGVMFEDMRLLTKICVIARESIKPIKPMLIELNPTPVALIIDIFTTDAIELSIPVYSFFTASTSLLALSLYMPTLDLEVEGEFVDLPAPVEIPGCKPLLIEDLLDQVKDRKNDEYKWYLLNVSRLKYAAGILVNSWENLDIQRITALKQNAFFRSIPTPPVFPIGPLIKVEETLTAKDAEILAWLDNQPCESVLLVALGSGGTLSSKQLIELAWGLEMSKQKFILVVRKPTDASASGTYFTVGSDEDDPLAYLPDGFLERTRGDGIVVPTWVPQISVLRHRSTGAFLSHCGWNSTLESLVQGIPIIAWPLFAEQRMNATMLVEEVGVAVKAAPKIVEAVVGRKEIETVVREVMEGEKGKMMRRRAAELKRSAAEALESGGSSHRSLSLLVDIWKSKY